MKSYLEVAEDVFRKGEVQLKEKQARTQKIKSGVAMAAVSAVVVFSAFAIAKGMLPGKTPTAPSVAPVVSQTSAGANGEDATAPKSSAPANATTASGDTHPTKRSGSAPQTSAQAPGKAADPQKPPKAGVPAGEKPTAADTAQNTPTSDPDTATPPTEDTAPTPETPEDPAPQPDDAPDVTTANDAPSTSSDTPQGPRRLSPGASSYNAQGLLQAAVEDNAFAWMEYNGRYYIHDRWTNADALEPGEKIGEADELEGNLSILGLAGDVYLPEDDDEACLLLKTSDDQTMAFLLLPTTD